MRNLVPERILANLKRNKFSDTFECYSMFVDISGFTKTTEALMKHGQEGAEVLSDILRYLFDTTVKAVYEHGGYVTKYAGDAFTAIFEIAHDPEVVARNVLESARITNRFFEENKVYRSKFGDFDFGVKVGLGKGDCTCGIAGSEKEKTYFFSGSAVDLCAMAEHNAEKGDIWMSESAYEFLKNVITEYKESELYGSKFYKAVRIGDIYPQRKEYSPASYGKELTYEMAGELETEFPIGEFRDIISVFISFQGEVSLNKLMRKVYELKDIYGCSHPVLDFGDKGGNVLLFFGAPISYENNSFRALSFITQLKSWVSGFDIRAGLAKGVVYCGFNGSELRNEFTCLGNTVNQSARFMMKASWGEILVDKALASNEQFEFTNLGSLQYKGREGLIPTFVLEKKAEIKDIFFKGNFIGRPKELNRLRKYLEPLIKGKNIGTVYVDGEAGIGKSRLTNQIRREFEKKNNGSFNINWLYFVSDDIIREPYNPLKYFFNRYFDFDEDDLDKNTEKFDTKFYEILKNTKDTGLRADLKKKRDYLAYFLKVRLKDHAVLTEEPNERQNTIILALISFFKTFTLGSSLIFEIDNGSTIDADSLKLFKRISHAMSRAAFGMILNCRFKDNGEVFDFGLPKQKRIKINPLAKSDFKDMAKDRLKLRSIPKATLAVLEDKSRMNPLYLEQMVIYIRENSVLNNKNIIKEPDSLPSGINQIILARIDKLTGELKDILKTASCIGNEIPVDLISYLFRSKYPDVRQFLTDLEKEDIFILFSEMSHLFKYAVIRNVVYDMQLKKTLRDIHGEVGTALENLHEKNIEHYYSILAYHFENAENINKALYYHEKAGYQDKENYHNDQALYHFDRASILISRKNGINENEWVSLDADKYCEQIRNFINIGLNRFHFYYAILQNISKSSEIIEILNTAANNINDQYLISQTLMEKSLILTNKGEYDKSNKYIENAIELYTNLKLPYETSLSYLSLGKNHMMTGEMDKAIKYYDLAIDQAELIEDITKKEKIKAKIYGDKGITFDYSGDFEKALEFYNKQLAITEKLTLKIEKSSAIGNIGVIYHMTGNLKKAKEYYEQKLKITEELGRRVEFAQILNNLGFLYKDLNNFSKAISYHRKSFSISSELNDHNTMASASVNLGHVYKLQKNFVKAETEYLKSIELSRKYALKYNMAEGLVELGEVYYLTSRTEEAFGSFNEGLSIAEDIGFAEYIEKAKIMMGKYFPEKFQK